MNTKLINLGLLLATLLFAVVASATIFGSVHGLIHDPQHRPVAGAHSIRAAASLLVRIRRAPFEALRGRPTQ